MGLVRVTSPIAAANGAANLPSLASQLYYSLAIGGAFNNSQELLTRFAMGLAQLRTRPCAEDQDFSLSCSFS